MDCGLQATRWRREWRETLPVRFFKFNNADSITAAPERLPCRLGAQHADAAALKRGGLRLGEQAGAHCVGAGDAQRHIQDGRKRCVGLSASCSSPVLPKSTHLVLRPLKF